MAVADSDRILQRMIVELQHRGPDDHGIWRDSEAGIGLAHTRLSIVDLSSAGHQPMLSGDERYVIVYNGEIYNHIELRESLRNTETEIIWRGHSDTETLLACIASWGIERTLTLANGMFALAVWDRLERRLTLARDRMGEKPLYFGWFSGCFAFASELKTLLHIPQSATTINAEVVSTFLGSGYIAGLKSAVRGIFRLPAGCSLTLSVENMERSQGTEWVARCISPYWSLQSTAISGFEAPEEDFASAAKNLEALLISAITSRMIADVPLGMFLSGGIDSSLIAALMQRQSTRAIRTFCIGFEDKRFDEAPHARNIARHLRTDHTELYVSSADVLSLVSGLAKTFDEPFADHSQIPSLLLSQLTKRHVTVALSGDGGDELFGGYSRYFSIVRLWAAIGWTPPLIRQNCAALIGAVGRVFQPFSRRANSLPFRMQRLAERVGAGNIDSMRASFIGGFGSSFLLSEGFTQDLERCRPPIEVQNALRRLMFADQAEYLPDDIMHKVDRASMAHSLEVRAPFLDHRVVEFSWKLPPWMLSTNNVGKQILRQILAQYVPKSLFDRPKQGFSPPLETWLRGPLRDWAESLLSKNNLRELPILDQKKVLALWRLHLGGRINAEHALWNVLMLASWRAQFGIGC